MDKFIIKGPTTLNGSVNISGSKNAALPIMTACLASPGKYTLNNVPNLRDTRTMIKLLEIIGSKVVFKNNTLLIDTIDCNNPEAPYDLVKTMRASFYVLGPLLSRFEYAKVSLPGGCAWGPRPIDFHLKAFESLGAKVSLKGGYIKTEGKLSATTVSFPKPSVGATGNVLMACINLNQKVIINNAAKEPEIVDLCNFIKKMGVSIDGVGTETLSVLGVKEIIKQNIVYDIIPDRIEAGTFLIAAASCGGNVRLKSVIPSHLNLVIQKLRLAGALIKINTNSVDISSNGLVNPVDIITDVYPGYPTDLQAQWIALMSKSNGSCFITDTIYTDRFTHIPELIRLGSKILLHENVANVSGVKKLFGAEVMSTDIRASASLIIAALSAIGKTELSRIYHIDRGYECIENKFKKLGANIIRVSN